MAFSVEKRVFLVGRYLTRVIRAIYMTVQHQWNSSGRREIWTFRNVFAVKCCYRTSCSKG